MVEIRHYLTPDVKDVYLDWSRKLRDITARAAIDRRLNRIEMGNLGDHKFCRDGVWELRIDGVQGTGCITQSPVVSLFYCCVAVTSEHKVSISTGPVIIGKTGKGERIERQSA